MPATLLSIGDELTLGQTIDTNAAYLAARLARLGIACDRHLTVPDDTRAIADAITHCTQRSQVLIITGGLGPTEDDLTRAGLAQAMGADLIEDANEVQRIRAYFESRGRPMPQRNRVQAAHPVGSTMIDNTCGTAPGIRATLNGCEVFVTPGVPREMIAMYQRDIEPAIKQLTGTARTILTTKVNSFGSGESDIAELLGELMARDRNPLVGTTVSRGLVSVRIRSEHHDPAHAQALLTETIALVQQRLAPLSFGFEDGELQDAVTKLLIDKGKTVATAESCTGGLIAKRLTDVAGSSAAVLGGWVTYANAMKTSQLGVPAELIERHGAVSAPVVEAMARGALEHSGADFALSTSGIAGPGGGSDDKPVGTVYLGLGWRDGETLHTLARLANLPGDREAVRDRSAKCALQLLRLNLMGEDLDHMKWVSKV